MPLTTPAQGFSYPLAADRPCDYPTTMLALAGQIDTKFQAFDVDSARLAKRKTVKISGTNTSVSSNASYVPLFDTVEFNNGTPTDLTIDPSCIQLGAGHWLLQAKFMVPTNSSGGNYYSRMNSVPANVVSQADTTARDYGGTWTPTTITLSDAAYVASGTAKVNLVLIYPGAAGSIPINYMSLSAWWIADA